MEKESLTKKEIVDCYNMMWKTQNNGKDITNKQIDTAFKNWRELRRQYTEQRNLFVV